MRYMADHFMYAAGSDFRNTIRTGIEMSEPVDEAILRQAVDRLHLRFPYFSVRLVREGEKYLFSQEFLLQCLMIKKKMLLNRKINLVYKMINLMQL